jgi:hypothetical protein
MTTAHAFPLRSRNQGDAFAPVVPLPSPAGPSTVHRGGSADRASLAIFAQSWTMVPRKLIMMLPLLGCLAALRRWRDE